MPINSNYNEEAIVEAIATALDNFYTNLISNIDAQEPVPVSGEGYEWGRTDY